MCHSSDAKPHRENAILLSPLPSGERSRAQRAGEGDRMFQIEVRYPLTLTLSQRGEGDEGAVRTIFFCHRSPVGRGRANAVSAGEGDQMFRFEVRIPLIPTLSPTERGS